MLSLAKTLGVLSFIPLTMLQACAQAVDFKVGHHFGEGQVYTYENQCLDPSYCSEHVKVNWNICRVGSAGCVMGAPSVDPRSCNGQTASPCADQLKTAWHKFN